MACSLFTIPAGAQGVAGDGSLPQVLEDVRIRHSLPALSVVVYHADTILESAHAGLRVVESGPDVTSADRWHLGSVAKSMTATLVGVLVERGILSWDATVAEVFPDLVGSIHQEYVSVRIDELLHHVSGLPNEIHTASWFGFLDRTDSAPVREQRRRWVGELLRQPPVGARGAYLYSNAGYVVAGAMIEEITGASWEALLSREVFEALGLQDAGFGAPGVGMERNEPWGHRDTGAAFRAIAPGDPDADHPPALGPAGTVHMSLRSLARYAGDHLRGSRGVPGLVSVETYRKLHTPAPGTQYALGWNVVETPLGAVLSHAGDNFRWVATLGFSPDQNLAVLCAANAGGGRATAAVDEAGELALARFLAWRALP